MKQTQLVIFAVVAAAIVVVATFAYLNSNEQQPYDGDDYQPPVDVDNGDDDSGSDLPMAADFNLPVVDDGGLLQLSNLRGKVVVLDFMATWCAPCATQMTELKSIQEEYSSTQVIVLSVDVDDSEGEDLISIYKAQKGIDWDIVRSGGSVASKVGYEVVSIPTIVIVDQEGHITYRNVGITQDTVLKAEIDKLLP